VNPTPIRTPGLSSAGASNLLIMVLLLVGVFAAGWLLRPQPPTADPHPITTDTLYYPLVQYERVQELIFEKGDDVVYTDTVPHPVVVERIVTETQYVGWELPTTWGVELLESPVSPAESLKVSLRGITADSLLGVSVDRRMERIWTPGYLTYLEVQENGELRMDFEPWEKESGGSFWRWVERGAIFTFAFWLGSQ
jgi:hypothetical protein